MPLPRPVCCCRSCGEMLYDGDTAYQLGTDVYCTSCVRAALIVCRCPDDVCPPPHAAPEHPRTDRTLLRRRTDHIQ